MDMERFGKIAEYIKSLEKVIEGKGLRLMPDAHGHKVYTADKTHKGNDLIWFYLSHVTAGKDNQVRIVIISPGEGEKEIMEKIKKVEKEFKG